MIDINLWQELSLFEKYGTLSKVSEKLFISQPALSRSMNKLEEEIGVTIFIRSKNKIELNNQNVLLYSEIGFWYKLVKDKAPNTNFLIQHDNNTFNTLLNTTSFPSFATNKSLNIYGRNQNNYKVLVPILDKEATANYYSVISKENYKKFAKLFNFIKDRENLRNI